jgi:hypothetical protein
MRIWYISPYSTEKNIGLALNEMIKQLNATPDDWIVHLDQDAMWLLPDSKAQVERILSVTDFDILGCMTNRLRSPEQLVGGRFNEDDRIREHIRIAQECRDNAGDMVVPARGVMAAFMLCFRVSVWEKVGGFVQDSINFDTQFNREAQLICEAKIGLMKGVYVFHGYRLWSKNPKQDCNHLIKNI